MDLSPIHYEKGHVLGVYSDSADYISRMIKQTHQFYEQPFLTFLKDHFPNQKNILDIGAHIGNHSLFFANYLHCQQIFSFEPFPPNIELFRHNLSKYNKCILYETALSDRVGKMVLYNTEHNNCGGFSLHKQEKSFVVQEVDVVPLDHFQFTDITLIKLDVENHETEVLRGGKQTILENKPTIVLENSHYYFSHLFPDPNPHAKIFEELGYKKIYSNVCNSAMDIWVPI